MIPPAISSGRLVVAWHDGEASDRSRCVAAWRMVFTQDHRRSGLAGLPPRSP
ncbi:hypothetical protein BV133_3211 [Blastochloris viridis]|uniref:Uncharacterized protein n=1 Tax=Blastochloris viridis TaxID=1079 RepID=A0A182D5U3_BLAVI|nr:hypothetical protein BV133_3211 [Blastochloris viridis]